MRLPQRATLSFSVSNPLGAADLLLHGSSKLHGWGQQTFVDPTLMYVRGFDSTAGAQRFKYEVNPRFGNANPQFNAFRAPITLTMQVRVDVGPSRERQQLTQLLDRGRKTQGQKVPEQQLRAQYSSGGLLNPMAQLLRSMDTLGLLGWQADSIASMNRRYTIRLDSIWSPVARLFAALPERYDQGEAYERYTTARKATVDMLITYAPVIDRCSPRPEAQAARARRELPRHPLSRRHPQRHGRQRCRRRIRRIRGWRWRWWVRRRRRRRAQGRVIDMRRDDSTLIQTSMHSSSSRGAAPRCSLSRHCSRRPPMRSRRPNGRRRDRSALRSPPASR